MAPLIPSLDPERLRELKIARLSPEGKELLDLLETCKDVGEKVVTIAATRFGIVGCAEYLRHCKHDQRELRQAAAALRAVGLVDEAMLCTLAAPSKRKPSPSWGQRVAAKHRRRTKELRKRQASNHRP
jgi:hypothetical protein